MRALKGKLRADPDATWFVMTCAANIPVPLIQVVGARQLNDRCGYPTPSAENGKDIRDTPIDGRSDSTTGSTFRRHRCSLSWSPEGNFYGDGKPLAVGWLEERFERRVELVVHADSARNGRRTRC